MFHTLNSLFLRSMRQMMGRDLTHVIHRWQCPESPASAAGQVRRALRWACMSCSPPGIFLWPHANCTLCLLDAYRLLSRGLRQLSLGLNGATACFIITEARCDSNVWAIFYPQLVCAFPLVSLLPHSGHTSGIFIPQVTCWQPFVSSQKQAAVTGVFKPEINC